MKSLDDLDAYTFAMELGRLTYEAVRRWDYFDKDTLGRQMVQAADSIPANIAEGYGRYTFPERIRFCLYARGSLFEFGVHLRKARERGIIEEEEYDDLRVLAEKCGQCLNGYIRHLRKLERSESMSDPKK